jgi:tetratricopeptide (TPR) repeat protein
MTDEESKTTSRLDRLDSMLSANSRWLVALFVGSFLLKLIYVVQSADALRVTVPIMDSEYYYNMASDILDGRVIRDDAFFMGPLYPYVLAVLLGVFGKSIAIVRVVQILAGALTVVLTYLVGKKAFRPSVALLGAVLLALYGTITFYEGQLLMMWLGTLLNMTALFTLYRWQDRPGLKKYVLVGVLIGLSALARANILVFLVVVVVWIAVVPGERRRLPGVGVLLVSVLVTILPATLHNYLASRDFVPITSNGGVNFYVGNSEDATGIFYPPKGINLVTDDAVKKYVERHLGREVKASELSRYWYSEAFDFMREHPGQALKLLLRKTAMYLNGYEMPQIESYDVARRDHSALRALFVNFWMLISLGLIGMVYSIKDWRRQFLLYGYVLAFSASVILFFITARYRAQIAPVLALYAAQTLIVIVPGAIANIRRQILPVVFIVLVVVVTRPGLFALADDDVQWRESTHEARRWGKLGDLEKAIAEINRAIEIKPDYVDSYIQRAVIYKEGGDLFKAVSDYGKAVDLNPNLSSVQYDFGQTLRQLRMYEPAIEAYQRAIELNPTMLEAYNNLGVTYSELKSYEPAAQYFRKVIEMNPRYTKAYNNLGAAYAQSGNLDAAIDAFKRAIEIDPLYANSYKNLAMAHVQRSEVSEGYEAMKQYLTLRPNDRNAMGVLEKLRIVLEGDTLQTAPK